MLSPIYDIILENYKSENGIVHSVRFMLEHEQAFMDAIAELAYAYDGEFAVTNIRLVWIYIVKVFAQGGNSVSSGTF
jgi:hypothetical protein